MSQAEDDWLADNRANWNDRAVVHAASENYGLWRYRDDPDHISDVVAFDLGVMPNIDGLRILHLQCHIGTDTISLERSGAASVVGVDFAEVALDIARKLARDSGARARFVQSDVAGAADAVGQRFDMVYTGVGAINWLPDLTVWAQTIFAVLEPGGQFYIREGHPFAWAFDVVDDLEGAAGAFALTYDYFSDPERPLSWDESDTYTDGDASSIRNTRHHEWSHTFADIINSLIGAGMVIDGLEEYRGCEWEFVPTVEKIGSQFFLPLPEREQVPLMFSLTAHRPA